MMMSDEDSTSRDSGICEMMDENTPMCFSSLSVQDGTSYQNEDLMEIDEDETLPGRVEYRPKKVTFRRQKSACQVRLFEESPTTPILSRQSSGALTVRHSNLQEQLNRKRTMEMYTVGKTKLVRRTRSSDHYHLEPSMTIRDDEDESAEMLDEIVETFSINQEQQSTSTGVTSFAVPRAKAKTKKTGLTHHNTAPAICTNDFDAHHLNVDYHLETTGSTCSSSFRRINAETLVNLISAMSRDEFNEKYILVDCRYPFEYDAGHINNAVNFYDPENVADLFYGATDRLHQRIPIFYCEFSQKRGPSMANALRKVDRSRSMSKYPNCDYEEMYVLDKGYREFFRSASNTNIEDLCVPHHYVEMQDHRFVNELRKYPFHKRSVPGSSVMRFYTAAARVFFPSQDNRQPVSIGRQTTPPQDPAPAPAINGSPPIDEENQENQEQQQAQANNTTPRIGLRAGVVRSLFGGSADSPTNYDRNLNFTCGSQTPSPVKTPSANLSFGL